MPPAADLAEVGARSGSRTGLVHQGVGTRFGVGGVAGLGRADRALTLLSLCGVPVAQRAGWRAPPAATRIGLGLSARHARHANASAPALSAGVDPRSDGGRWAMSYYRQALLLGNQDVYVLTRQ